MKPLDIIKQEDEIYIFYDNNILGILDAWREKYSDEKSTFNLGYDIPDIAKFGFLGYNYPCIRLWYDGEHKECSDSYNKLIDKFGLLK